MGRLAGLLLRAGMWVCFWCPKVGQFGHSLVLALALALMGQFPDTNQEKKYIEKRTPEFGWQLKLTPRAQKCPQQSRFDWPCVTFRPLSAKTFIRRKTSVQERGLKNETSFATRVVRRVCSARCARKARDNSNMMYRVSASAEKLPHAVEGPNNVSDNLRKN